MTSTRPARTLPRVWCFSCSPSSSMHWHGRPLPGSDSEGAPGDLDLGPPLKARTISGLDRRRRVADFVATALVTLSMLIALLPLVWVLCSVVAKGFKAHHVERVVDAFTIRYNRIRDRRRRLPRDRRHRAAGIGVYRAIRPDRCHGRDLSGRIRRRHPAGQAGHIHGGHPQRGSLDRGGIVHLRAAGGDDGSSPFRIRGVAGAGVVDGPGDCAGDRGDAADRSGRSSRGQLRVGDPQVENHCQDCDSDGAGRDHHGDHAGGGQGAGRDRPVADPGRLLAGNKFQHLQRVHGIAARHDVLPDIGRRGQQPGSHRSTMGQPR
jgi:hypothetical protein